MSTLIKLRRDTSTNWTAADPVLALGEAGIETDTLTWKVGDGTTAWNDLPYMTSGGGEAGLPLANGTSNFNIATVNGNATVTVAGARTWTFDTTGNVTIPGDIIGLATIDIDNRATGNSADINLFAADDITLQARDRTAGSGSEGGDINIYAGDSAEDSDSSGGDVEIRGGDGGAANVDFGGSGGFIRIQTGQGGAASTSVSGASAAGGGELTLRAGDAGSNMGNIARGAEGGGVVIEAGDSTGNLAVGGSINLRTGAGGANAAAGSVIFDIPSSDAGPGGEWIFDDQVLRLPGGGTVRGDDNVDIGSGNAISLEASSAVNVYTDTDGTSHQWQFAPDGTTIFPTLTVTRGDRTGTLTGQALLFGDSTQEALISTPNGDNDNNSSQRFVINPGAGADGTTGEGGDIYLYAGRGGNVGGSGGDIKIRGGLGPVNGAGGYLDLQGGDTEGNGTGGYIDIRGGESGNAVGGAVNVYGGYGATNGGDVNITGGQSGNSLSDYGNVNIAAGASTWRFDNTGNLTLPSNDFTVNYANGTPVSLGGGGAANTGNVTFDNINIIGDGNLKLQPDPANSDAYLDIFLTTGPDIHIAGNGETVILGTDDFANVAVNVDGNVSIQSSNGTPYTWTFDTAGNLTLPGNASSINYADGSPFSGAPVNTGDLTFNQSTIATTQSNAYINLNAFSAGDIDIGTNDDKNVVIRTDGSTANNAWTFDATGNLTLPGATAGETIATQSGYITVGNLLIGQGGALLNSNNDSWALYGNISDPGTAIFIPSNADAGNGIPLYIESQQSNVEIRSGSSTWNFGNTSNLTLPSGGVVSEGVAPTGLGNTIAITPSGGSDANQQLLVYPTGNIVEGNHLHLTTGDLYNTELFLGNDNLYVKLANTGNVVINSYDGDTGNTAQWTFDTAGNLTLPGNIIAINYADGNRVTGGITFSGEAVIGTGTSNTQSGLYLAPDPVSLTNDLYLRVRGNIIDEPTHIHFDTGNNQYYNQFIGDDNKYIQLANTGNIIINSNDAAGNSAQWIFNNFGTLTLPGGSQIRPLGANLDIFAGTGSYVNLTTSDESSRMGVDNGGGYIVTAGGTWGFSTTGNLTLPGNTFAVNYADGTPVNIGGGSYGNADVADFLANGFGSNTISTTGNIALGNIVPAVGSNVIINSDSNTWIFNGTTGNITIPSNGAIRTPSGSDGNILIHPDGVGTVVIQGNAAGALLKVTGDEVNSLNRIEVDTYGNVNTLGGIFTGTFTRGTPSAPDAVQTQDRLAAFTGKGYDGTVLSPPAGQISIDAVGAWSPGNHGTHISFFTTPTDSTTIREVVRVAASGNLDIYNAGNIVLSGGNIVGANVVIANAVSTTGQITSTGAGNAADGGGQIYLNGATNNRIDWNTNGTGAPEYTTRSAGAKVVLYPAIGGSAADYALGVEAGASWSGIPGNDAGQFFKWYGGNVLVASLSGTGAFSAVGNVTGANILTAGSVVTTPTALANLTAVAGARAFVNNGNLVAAGNFGAQIGSGGANVVPVWSDGTNWYIG